MKTKWLAGLSLTVIAAFGASSALAGGGEDKFKSGLQPGDSTSPFQCRDITGPNKGKSLCYI